MLEAEDQRIFNALVLAYFTPLVQFVVGIVHLLDAAEDIVQGVLYRVWEQRATWNPHGSVRAYLLRAVRNLSARLAQACRDRSNSIDRRALIVEEDPRASGWMLALITRAGQRKALSASADATP